MKTLFAIILGIVLTLWFSPLQAQTDTTKQVKANHPFVDKDGDGYNDNAPDDDGDGIPNGLDPDYKPGKKKKVRAKQFIDLDGDGINDHLQTKEGSGPHQKGKNLQKNEESLLQQDGKERKGRNGQGGKAG